VSDVQLGNNHTGPNWYAASPSITQFGSPFACPVAGNIHHIAARWMALSYPGSASRVVLWDGASGSILGQGGLIYPTYGTYPGQVYEADITPVAVTAGQQVVIGFWYASKGDPVQISEPIIETTGTMWAKAAGSSAPGSMSGHGTVAYTMDAWALLTSAGGIRVKRSGAWVPATLRIKRNGSWVAPAAYVRRSGAWVRVQ
jgi:hypothetical protein